MLDIREGDLLVLGTKEYPVKACNQWSLSHTANSSFLRLAVLDVSTKRATVVDGKRQSASPFVANLKATPLDPVGSDTARSLNLTVELDSPTTYLQTFITDGTSFSHLVIEDLR